MRVLKLGVELKSEAICQDLATLFKSVARSKRNTFRAQDET